MHWEGYGHERRKAPLNGLTLHVADVERSLQFYQRLPGVETVQYEPGTIAHATTTYTYATNMNEVYGRLGHDGEASVVLPAIWGPMLARYLGGPQSIRDAVSPKREVYRFVRERTGERFQDVAFDTLDDRRRMLRAEATFNAGLRGGVDGTLSMESIHRAHRAVNLEAVLHASR